MARAKVELQMGVSHTWKGRKIQRGKPQIITNASDIAYYKVQPGFKVTMLEEAEKPQKKAAPKLETPKEPEPVADNEKTQPDAPKTYTAKQLKEFTKPELAAIADELEIFLKGTEKKSEMIRAILKAQKK